MKIRPVLTALLLSLVLAAPALAQDGEARVEVAVADYDFGTVAQGEQVSYVFRLRNSGSAPLVIERVRSSCGCTVPRLSSEILAPGEIGEVETVFDSTQFRGAVVKTIYLYTNAPQQRVVQLNLRGEVREILTADPPRIDFGTLKAGTGDTARITLHNRGQKTLVLEPPAVTGAHLRAELERLRLEPGASTSVAVTIAPEAASGRISGYVIINTSDQPGTSLRLPVFGSIAP